MKYENFDEAKGLVEQIQKAEKLHNQLSGPVIIVEIIDQLGGVIQTIGAQSSYEHDYTPYAETFIGTIKSDLRNEIEVLKTKLDAL